MHVSCSPSRSPSRGGLRLQQDEGRRVDGNAAGAKSLKRDASQAVSADRLTGRVSKDYSRGRWSRVAIRGGAVPDEDFRRQIQIAGPLDYAAISLAGGAVMVTGLPKLVRVIAKLRLPTADEAPEICTWASW